MEITAIKLSSHKAMELIDAINKVSPQLGYEDARTLTTIIADYIKLSHKEIKVTPWKKPKENILE